MVLDMEEDQEVPLILGQPFLAMGRALIQKLERCKTASAQYRSFIVK